MVPTTKCITVAIPVFNQCHLTERCLNSLLANSSHISKVVVVNNGSTDGTRDLLMQAKPRFEQKHIQFLSIHNDENRGFGRACNQGIRESETAYTAILNNDTWLAPDWDVGLLSALEKNNWGVVGPYFFEGTFDAEVAMKARATAFIAQNKTRTRKHFVPILFLLDRITINQLKFDHGGVFDERFFVTYEDTDLIHRMDLKKIKYGQTGVSFIWHFSRGTRGKPELGSTNHAPAPHEVEGLRLFIEKWGFDPRPQDHTLFKKLRRAWWKFLEKRGSF